jgi:hypothetical protein
MKISKFKLPLIILLLFSFLLADSALGEQKEEKRIIPDKVIKELEEGLSTLQSNGVFNLSFSNSFFFPAQMGKTFTSVIFKGELKKDLEEIKEIKKEELQPPYYKFFMQVYRMNEKGKELYHEYFSPIPFDGEDAEFYSFGIPLEEGEYLFAIEVTRSDLSKFGTLFFKILVPSMFKKELDFSTPFFIKEIKELPEPETIFTVHRNSIAMGRASISPYLSAKFKVEENPTLFFYVIGAQIRDDGTTNLELNITIKDEKKDVLKYTPVTLSYPVIAQPMVFKSQNFTLQKGNYTLEVKIKDKVANKEKTGNIPFEMIE